MTELERSYNIPLRKEWLKVPKYRRAKKAVKALREFLTKHMKSENLHIGKQLNELIWGRGIKNPPHHVNVNVLKDEEGRVFAELVGHDILKPEKKEEKKTEGKADSVKEKLAALKKKSEKKSAKKDDKSVSDLEKAAGFKEKKEDSKVEKKEEVKKEESEKTEVKAEKKTEDKSEEKVETKKEKPAKEEKASEESKKA